MEEAFDRTSFDVITQAAERHGNEPTICRWTSSMLENRDIITIMLGETRRASTARGCPAGRCTLTSAVQPGCGWASLAV